MRNFQISKLRPCFRSSLAHPAGDRFSLDGLTGRGASTFVLLLWMPVRSGVRQRLDTSLVPHGHPKNDAATCGKPTHVTHSTQDGRNNEKQDEKEPGSVHPRTP